MENHNLDVKQKNKTKFINISKNICLYGSIVFIILSLAYYTNFLWKHKILNDYVALKQNLKYVFSNNINNFKETPKNKSILLQSNKLIDLGLLKGSFKDLAQKDNIKVFISNFDYFKDNSSILILNIIENDVKKDNCLLLSNYLFHIYDGIKINNTQIDYKTDDNIQNQITNICKNENKLELMIFIKPLYSSIFEEKDKL